MFRFAQMADVPAQIELVFEEGIPVAVNGIAMSLPELTESLSTIAGDHGIALLGAAPVDESLAELVVNEARRALASIGNHPDSGIVRMKLHDGEQTVVSVSPVVASHS